MSLGGNNLVISRWSARFMRRTFPCSVGRNGLGIKQSEGDGITPFGTFQIEFLWVRPDRVSARLPHELRQTGLRDQWCEDPLSPDYNQPVLSPHAFSTESLRRSDPLYDLVAVLNYNRHPVTPGKGSAIFLHLWRKPRHPTAGCVAFARRDLLWILQRWTRQSQVIIR